MKRYATRKWNRAYGNGSDDRKGRRVLCGLSCAGIYESWDGNGLGCRLRGFRVWHGRGLGCWLCSSRVRFWGRFGLRARLWFRTRLRLRAWIWPWTSFRLRTRVGAWTRSVVKSGVGLFRSERHKTRESDCETAKTQGTRRKAMNNEQYRPAIGEEGVFLSAH